MRLAVCKIETFAQEALFVLIYCSKGNEIIPQGIDYLWIQGHMHGTPNLNKVRLIVIDSFSRNDLQHLFVDREGQRRLGQHPDQRGS